MSLIQELVENLGISRSDLARIIATAPARYKVYEIPKRHGGNRVIAQPSRELKEIQRYILREKLSAFPVHSAAMAYVSGRGILHNAWEHRQGKYLLKLDFKNFFPSIRTIDWLKLCDKSKAGVIDNREMHLYSKVLFWGKKRKSILPRCLSIGAPTSPALSNILMFDLDQEFAQAARRLGVIYTRYADDIAVSGSNYEPLRLFEAEIRQVIRSSKNPRLTFNDDKRGMYRRGERRMVTGLIITPDERVSIGRARKREISALLHRSSLGQLDIEKKGYLKGMLAFCIASEPEFVKRMRTKYGNEPVNAALAYHVPSLSDRDEL